MNHLESLFKPMPNLRKPNQSKQNQSGPMNTQSKQPEAEAESHESLFQADKASLESQRYELYIFIRRNYMKAAEALAEPDCPNPDYLRGLISAYQSTAKQIKRHGVFFDKQPFNELPY
jgi:hypothetical protein